MKKKLFLLFLILAILSASLMFAVSISGQDQPSDPLLIIIDDKLLETDVPSVIVSGRTMVPLRAIFEAIGAEVQWNGITRTVTASKGQTVIDLQIGSKTARKNGFDVELEAAPFISSSRTMVPVRFISEAFGAEVSWDAVNRYVVIRTPGSPVFELVKAAELFPFASNVHMKYKGTGNEYAQYETYVDYIREGVMQLRNSNGGTVSVIVYKHEGKSVKKVYQQGEIYYRHDFTSKVNRNEILIKEPIVKGNSWILSDGAVRTITDIRKQLKLPSGDYTAVEITTERADTIQKDYYVLNKGLVKTDFAAKDNSYVVTSELEQYEMGAPYRQRLRFYYPFMDFHLERIFYIERDIELYTNQDMKKIFEEQLKLVPTGSGLTRTLTLSTKVLGYTIDETYGSVIVDISSDFVREMNAGTTLEGMLLQSIANTFGHYYQKAKVGLRMDGRDYESGHFLFRAWEYLNVDYNINQFQPRN